MPHTYKEGSLSASRGSCGRGGKRCETACRRIDRTSDDTQFSIWEHNRKIPQFEPAPRDSLDRVEAGSDSAFEAPDLVTFPLPLSPFSSTSSHLNNH